MEGINIENQSEESKKFEIRSYNDVQARKEAVESFGDFEENGIEWKKEEVENILQAAENIFKNIADSFDVENFSVAEEKVHKVLDTKVASILPDTIKTEIIDSMKKQYSSEHDPMVR